MIIEATEVYDEWDVDHQDHQSATCDGEIFKKCLLEWYLLVNLMILVNLFLFIFAKLDHPYDISKEISEI